MMRHGERIACPDCGLLQDLPPARAGHRAQCGRCARVLAGLATGRVEVPLALALTALLFFIPAVVLPLLGVASFGAHRYSWLYSGVTAFDAQGFWPLGLLLAAFALIFPLIYLGGLVWVLANLKHHHLEPLGRIPLGRIFRWVGTFRPWMMLEVYLVGGFVAYSRINAVASIEVEAGGWCLLVATFSLMIALTQLDERTVWAALPVPVTSITPPADGFVACTVCDWIAPHDAQGSACARCQATLHPRKPESVQRTIALVTAGYLLYIPANLLPVLTIVRFGHEERSTILSGVFELIRNDLWPLAAIVFAASIVLPLMKLFGLTWMLIAINSRARNLLVSRTRLYRVIDAIGRWSNIDVFMAALLIALLQFGTLTQVYSGPGLLAFAGVVVVTMFATLVFDTRLMWDAAGRNTRVSA